MLSAKSRPLGGVKLVPHGLGIISRGDENEQKAILVANIINEPAPGRGRLVNLSGSGKWDRHGKTSCNSKGNGYGQEGILSILPVSVKVTIFLAAWLGMDSIVARLTGA